MRRPVTDAAAIQRRLFWQITQAPRALTATGLCIIVAAAAIVAQAMVTASAIAGAAGGRVPRWPVLALLLAVVVLRAAATGGGEAAAQRVATAAKSDIRNALVTALLRRGRVATQERTGAIVTLTMDGVEKLDAFYRRFVPQALATAIVPLIVLVTVLSIDPLSGLVLALTGPLIPVFMWLLGSLAERRAREQWQALSVLGGRFLDTLQGLPTLVQFGRAADAAAAMDTASDTLRRKTMEVLRVAFLSGLVLEIAASVSTAVVAVSVGVRLLEGWMPFEAGLAVLLLTPEFYLPFRQLGQRHHAGMEGVAAAEQLFALLDATPRTERKDSTPGPVFFGMSTQHPSLTLDHITVHYPGAAVPALEDVSVTIAPNTFTAIVGPSGAGKSTLLSVLLRFIEPTSGDMQMDDVSASQLSPAEWRRRLSLVPQVPHFIAGSLLDNLRLGRPEATLEEVAAAARLAHADGFIASRPDGYLARMDEVGSAFSGGERQRLALARALVKNAGVLLLDEPTSSLDAHTEACISDTLRRVARDRTVIVVSHRAETIAHADAILTFAAGRLVSACHAQREVA